VLLSDSLLGREKLLIIFGKMHSSVVIVLLALSSLNTVIAAPHSPTRSRYLNNFAQDYRKLWFGTAAGLPETIE
jgi:hypothetical protein